MLQQLKWLLKGKKNVPRPYTPNTHLNVWCDDTLSVFSYPGRSVTIHKSWSSSPQSFNWPAAGSCFHGGFSLLVPLPLPGQSHKKCKSGFRDNSQWSSRMLPSVKFLIPDTPASLGAICNRITTLPEMLRWQILSLDVFFSSSMYAQTAAALADSPEHTHTLNSDQWIPQHIF